MHRERADHRAADTPFLTLALIYTHIYYIYKNMPRVCSAAGANVLHARKSTRASASTAYTTHTDNQIRFGDCFVHLVLVVPRGIGSARQRLVN